VVVFGALHAVKAELSVYPEGQVGAVQEPQLRVQQGHGVPLE